MRGFRATSTALATLDDDVAGRVVEQLREALAVHHHAEHGVVFDSRS